jgi:2-polyprenyl-6-methoxyphenol hydroxylase-like FAD-dependent oxidoreductase
MQNAEVLIVGAGPTGLVMALRLAHHGVPFRIVDKNSGPGQASRAMIVHARTLEFYDQLGFGSAVVERGIQMQRVHVREGGKDAASVSFADLGGDLSPHPFVLCFPQDDHERFLVDRLTAAGVRIEWNTELIELDRSATDSVTASIRHAETQQHVTVKYVCGCDGAHSAVRHALGIDFPGGSYDQVFYVADVQLQTESPPDLFMNLAEGGFVLMLPVRSTGMRRLIGTIPLALQGRPDISFADVQPYVESMLGLRVSHLNWYSTYHVHHRVAAHFRAGRVFISGDAAHLHSPAGGQGMNTGIGDAVNLSWKLANVLQGRIVESALDTYEPERMAFAHKLVETTDRAFQGLVAPGFAGQILRRWLVPHLAPIATDFEAVRRLIFKTLSQIHIEYRHSALSEGRAGDVHAGDRLPWIGGGDDGVDNFTVLGSCDWQCHVYGSADAAPASALISALTTIDVPTHTFVWSKAAARAGLKEDAVYLLRPDGHVAFAASHLDIEPLMRYAKRIGLVKH